jgi:hypothetical protein
MEQDIQSTMVKVAEIISKNVDKEKISEDDELFPNHTKQEIFYGMPPAIIMTSEFGYNRKMAEEAACLFLKAGKLVEFGCFAGMFHNFYANY